MRDDGGAHVTGVVAQTTEPRAQGLLGADLEPGQAVVEDPGDPTREVVGLGDRRPVLSGVEEDESVPVLDDVGIDGLGSGPGAGGEQPQGRGPPA